MEKMLDKRSRDFAKNMRDKMIYDKSKNEVKIRTNLYVDGSIAQNGEPIGGTKLYKHYLYASSIDYKFTLITTNPEPIDFTNINTFKKLYEYLLKENVLQFTGQYMDEILYNLDTQTFYSISIGNVNSINVCVPSYYDDWPLSDTTDTVTEI